MPPKKRDEVLDRLRKAMWRLMSKPAPITTSDGVFVVVLDKVSAQETAIAIENLISFTESIAALRVSLKKK